MERVVEHHVRFLIDLTQCEERGDRREADDGRPDGRQGEAGVDELCRPDEVDRDDLPPAGHGRRHTGNVGDGPQRSQVRHPRGQAGDAVAVLDVELERLDLRRRAARREALCGLGEDQFVAVDQQQDVDHVRYSFGTGPSHPSGGPRHDAHVHMPLLTASWAVRFDVFASSRTGAGSKEPRPAADTAPDHRRGGPSAASLLPRTAARQKPATWSISNGVGSWPCHRQSESLPRVACAASAASNSGASLPSAANGSCRREARGALAKCRPAARPPPTLPPFHSTANVVVAMSPLACAQHAVDPAPDLRLGGRLLRQLVGQVAPQALTTVLQDGGDEGVLGPEVPVEGLVGQAGHGHDVGDPWARRRAAPPHDLEGGIEQPADLAGVLVLPFGQRAADDPPGDAGLGFRYCILDSQNHILSTDRGRAQHGVGLRDRSGVPEEAGLGGRVRPRRGRAARPRVPPPAIRPARGEAARGDRPAEGRGAAPGPLGHPPRTGTGWPGLRAAQTGAAERDPGALAVGVGRVRLPGPRHGQRRDHRPLRHPRAEGALPAAAAQRRVLLELLHDRAACGRRPDALQDTRRQGRGRVGDQRVEVLLLQRQDGVVPHRHGGHQPRREPLQGDVDVPGADRHARRAHRAQRRASTGSR